MVDWESRVSDHPVLGSLTRLADEIGRGKVTLEEHPSGDAALLQDLDRLEEAHHWLQGTLNATIPSLASDAALKSVQNHVDHVVVQLTSFNSNRNAAHLVSANAQIEEALASAAVLPVPHSEGQVSKLAEAIVSFRRSVGQHISLVSKDYEALVRKLEEAATEWERSITTIREEESAFRTDSKSN